MSFSATRSHTDLHWPPETVALLCKLWDEGLTCSEIAPFVKRSRAAISGMVHRLRQAGYPFTRPSVSVIERKPGPAEDSRRTPRNIPKGPKMIKPPTPVKTAPQLSTEFARPWLERKPNQCAFPISGEGADTWSCCAPTHGRTYCPAHFALTHTHTPLPRLRAA